ncbi:MAG: ABC transporter ATP-binding protein, partial [Anaerolineae bacterium]|nr:ABC transporter ATP-binding protein [Anaerolineae bacterium]
MKRLNIYGRLIAYLKPYWRQAVLAYAAMFFATLLNLFVPLVIARAIDQGLESGQATALFVAAAIILGIALVRALASFGQRYFG